MGQPVMQFQILTTNPTRSAEFYTKLFGWEVNQNNALGYRMIDTGSDRGINGGIWPSPPGAHGFVQMYVEVDDVKRYLTNAAEYGAKVVIPPQQMPDGDELAVLQDPDGVTFGIYKPAAA